MAQQINILQDISSYTKIPLKILNELVYKEELCIGSAINDAKLNNEQTVVLNIGIGSLGVDLSTMQCKFIPSKDFKTILKKSFEDKIDPIEFELENELRNKLLSICEDTLQ